ncbi:hypothetical protein HYH03_003179 [Edaphochlamys debaryana]|uniref:Uncharacterized protein n=1 Tax=Edaphochlamys debaryana TaxID=47281 RepID=A0A835YAB2_9CHLO|nr:hypothetical protein HYH03_003179 [Edaphochlamys debaryana]|eukprot:KAG2498993.1 hypothetical protein HYH03_003179 [Edaphochlamys debaryana]
MGCGCTLLSSRGYAALAARSQLTRLVIDHRFHPAYEYKPNYRNVQRSKYESYDYAESPKLCPYNNTAEVSAIQALISLRNVVIIAHPRAVSPRHVQALLDALPPSATSLAVAGVQHRSYSPNAKAAIPDRGCDFLIEWDGPTKTLTIRFELADAKGLAWLAWGALMESSRLFSSGHRLATLRFDGVIATENDYAHTAGLAQLRPLVGLCERVEVRAMRLGDVGRDGAEGLEAAVAVLGIPERLELGTQDEEHPIWLPYDNPCVCLREPAAGVGDAADGAEPQPQPPVGPSTAVAEFVRRLCSGAARPLRRDPDGGRKHARPMLVLRGELASRAAAGPALALRAMQRLEAGGQRAAAAAGERRARGRGGRLRTCVRRFVPLPSAGALLVECESDKAAERLTAAAGLALRAVGGGVEEGEGSDGGATGAAGVDVTTHAVESGLGMDRGLPDLSRAVAIEVLKAVWDGTEPRLSRKERLRGVLLVWDQLWTRFDAAKRLDGKAEHR